MEDMDITLMYSHALNAARNYLENQGSLPTFAYVMETGDQLTRIVPKEDALSDRGEALERFRAYLRLEARQRHSRAVAIIMDSRLDAQTNGSGTCVIRVELDHVELAPRVWLVPYQVINGRYKFGNPDGSGIIHPGERFIFTD